MIVNHTENNVFKADNDEIYLNFSMILLSTIVFIFTMIYNVAGF